MVPGFFSGGGKFTGLGEQSDPTHRWNRPRQSGYVRNGQPPGIPETRAGFRPPHPFHFPSSPEYDPALPLITWEEAVAVVGEVAARADKALIGVDMVRAVTAQ
jgi:hypothetical protein